MTRQDDRRRFPRAAERLPVQLRLDDGKREFQATMYSADVSLTGVFLSSEFFLKPGLEMNLEFQMPDDDRTVRVRGVVVREVRVDERSGARADGVRAGFAMRFTEYLADAKTVLASAFLGAALDDFVEEYLDRRSKKPRNEMDQLRDVVIAWEVGKMDLAEGERDLLRGLDGLRRQPRTRRR